LNHKYAFDRYPSLEVVADAISPKYRVKYIECVKEGSSLRFVKKEKVISIEGLDHAYARFMEEIVNG
jgi:hypothetical protein